MCRNDGSPGSLGGVMRRFGLVLLLLAVTALAAGCGIVVSDVKGIGLEDARASLAAAGFRVGAVSFDEESNAPKGTVIKQSPEGGTRADKGTSVSLVLAGTPPVATPDLSGMTKDEAVSALQTLGLHLGDVSESFYATTPLGIIASQSPVPGSESDKGGAVAVLLSKGPAPVRVPNMVGSQESVARVAIESVGFSVKIATEDSTKAKGTVLSQQPAMGEAKRGTAVMIVVSTGLTPRPSASEATSAMKRLAAAHSAVPLGRVSGLKMARDSRGRWWAGGRVYPAEEHLYDAPNAYIVRESTGWRLVALGTAVPASQLPEEVRSIY